MKHDIPARSGARVGVGWRDSSTNVPKTDTQLLKTWFTQWPRPRQCEIPRWFTALLRSTRHVKCLISCPPIL